jgi:hypothetical protein
MLTYEDAVPLARQHVAGLSPVEGWVWRLSEGVCVEGGWYFDYAADRLPSNPPGPGTGFGYAPGFIVTDGGQILVIGWQQLRSVREVAERIRSAQE